MQSKKKIEPWRILVFIVSAAFIVFIWIKKDIAAIYTTMPKEQIAPLIVTTILVTLFKVLVITGALLLIKWIVSKIKNRDK